MRRGERVPFEAGRTCVRRLTLGARLALLGVAAASLVSACSLRGEVPGGSAASGGRSGNGNGNGGRAPRGGTAGFAPGTDCPLEQQGHGRCTERGMLEVCKAGTLVVAADCGYQDRCSAARAVCLDCAPGSFRCSGDALEQCNLEGSGYELVRVCASADACVAEPGKGYCTVCTPDAATCEPAELEFSTPFAQLERATRPNTSLRQCAADGSGTRAVARCDFRSSVCDPGSGQCLVCAPGTVTCRGAGLFRCDADGSALVLEADCGHPARCDASAAACSAPGCADGAGERVAAGQVRCRGANRTELSVCGESGLWEILDLCDSAAACSFGMEPRRCLDDAEGYCVPGSARCVANAVQRCADFTDPSSAEVSGGNWYVFGRCSNQCVASAAGVADCDDPTTAPPYMDASACEPGSTSYLDCSSTACVPKACSGGQVCAGNNSGCQACVPDKFRCEGNVLKACNMTGTSEAVVEDCGAGVCDSFRRKCLPALPGERVCRGGDLQRVGADGNVQTIASCGAQALCDPQAGCRPALCVVGSVVCDGARVLRCDDGLELVDAETRCSSSERCEDGLGCARAARLAAGEAHTCALVVPDGAAPGTSGYVKCWGANDRGQLGNGAPLLGDEPEARPVVKRAGSALIAVPHFRDTGLCAGRHFSCADVVLESGESAVVCWGANDRGQLGIGAARARAAGEAVNHVVAPVTGGSDVAPRDGVGDALLGLHAVTCGAEFACALDGDGHVWCWGSNDSGQLGVGQAGRAALDDAQGVAPNRTFQSVVAGARHACALDSEGALWCWGDGSNGQLGQLVARLSAEPVRVRGLMAAEVALGRDFTLVRGPADATVLAFGQNFFGQLSTGNDLPANVPVATSGLAAPSTLFSGPAAAHGCALLDGSLVCWGANPLGQLGDGSVVDRYRPVKSLDARVTELDGGPGSVALGAAHTCAIDNAGNVWCWGKNTRHELGARIDGQRSVVPQLAF